VKFDLDEEIKKPKGRNNGFYTAQIPVDLLKSKEVSMEAKVCYALLHSYAREKNLRNGKSQTFVSQSKLAKDLGVTVRAIKNWLRELRISGWVKVKKRKGTRSNITTLNIIPKNGGSGE